MTTTRSRLKVAALGALIALTLSACTSTTANPGQADDAPDAAPEGDPAPGGSLRFAIANDPGSLTPAGGGSGNDARYVTRQVVDSLVDQDPETGELVPWLATDWEISEDATRFTFTLREDVTFSDGTAFTAESVKATLDDIVDQGAVVNYAIGHLAGYEGTEVLEEHVAEVTFSEPSIPFLQALSEPALAPIADASLAQDWDERVAGGVIGTGPFALESYTPNGEVVLAAREEYAWPSEVSENSGAAYLDEIVFSIVAESSVRTGSLQSGAVDVIGGVPPQDQDTLEASGFPLVIRANPGTTFGITPFTDLPFVSEVEVRRAISLAIDTEAVRDAVLNTDYAVSRSVLSDTTPGFADLSEYLTYDPAEANELLDAAGFETGPDGIRTRDGEPLSLTLVWSENFLANQSTVELIQQQLGEVGIDLQLTSVSGPERTAGEERGDYHLRYGNLSRSDGDILRTNFSHATNSLHTQEDPDLDELLTAQRGIVDTEERDGVLRQAQEHILSQGLNIPTYQLTSILGTAPGVHGVELGADSRLAPLGSAWIEEEA